jgi:hypothetical protein
MYHIVRQCEIGAVLKENIHLLHKLRKLRPLRPLRPLRQLVKENIYL